VLRQITAVDIRDVTRLPSIVISFSVWQVILGGFYRQSSQTTMSDEHVPSVSIYFIFIY